MAVAEDVGQCGERGTICAGTLTDKRQGLFPVTRISPVRLGRSA